MTVRVIARVKPQQQHESDKDVILTTASTDDTSGQPTLVKIPNPKNESEYYTFQFSSVYDSLATQQEIFDNEVSPSIKHLFNGFDVTIFAYGSTGTGKTHTMRGGKSLAERGIIPRLLSGIYRKARKIDKDSAGKTTVEINLSYYEIYNDKVFDLFEAPEKRTLAGLPLRDNGGKTIVVGLTERPCKSLKEFEKLYDQANTHRSTSATKLNAVSSRSHAILGIKLAVTTDAQVRVSTASAIDLAGSEDNRRTENGKDRMVESASINKSLFVLAKCVEAISSNSSRIPYRESKMTRILSLGQNNGLTIMVLNLAPTRPYHLDTLSSLNFANRTKKIEIREIENEPVFKGCSRAISIVSGKTIDRQPLRPIANDVHNRTVNAAKLPSKQGDKRMKAFSVYSDCARNLDPAVDPPGVDITRDPSLRKRPSDPFSSSVSRPFKRRSPNRFSSRPQPTMSKDNIEDIIEKKVTDILAARALDQTSMAPQPAISKDVQRRLDLLEQKINGKDSGRGEGLTFLLMAKQHAVREEYTSAVRMYNLARPYFSGNAKLDMKIENLQEKAKEKRSIDSGTLLQKNETPESLAPYPAPKTLRLGEFDDDYLDEEACSHEYESDAGFRYKTKARKARPDKSHNTPAMVEGENLQTPRTKYLLEIVNRRDVTQIRALKGVGAKKAEAIVEALYAGDGEPGIIHNLGQLERLKGVSTKTVEAMRSGLQSIPR